MDSSQNFSLELATANTSRKFRTYIAFNIANTMPDFINSGRAKAISDGSPEMICWQAVGDGVAGGLEVMA